ncbi:MAG: Sensor histidine kinase RcsC [Phycisphaerae bacterium]|nr:Sensor histidine kinase RcsC [Phycisphaerae bacterium]
MRHVFEQESPLSGRYTTDHPVREPLGHADAGQQAAPCDPFEALADLGDAGVIRTDADGNCTYVNQRWCQIAGLQPHQAMGRGWLDAVDIEDRERITREWMITADTQQPFTMTCRLRTAEKMTVWLLGRVAPLRDAEGRITGYLGVITDISARKRAEKALRITGQRYRAAIEGQSELVCRITPGLKVAFANEAFQRLLRSQRRQLIGKSILDFVPREDRKFFRARLAVLLPENPSQLVEHRMLLPSGQAAWIEWTQRAIFDMGGHLAEYHCVGRDVSQRKAVEQDLQRREQQYRDLLESTNFLITQVDRDGRFIYVNAAARSVFGLEPRDMIGQSAFDFVHPDDREQTRREFESWIRDRRSHLTFENRQIGTDGRTLHMAWSISAHFGPDGQLTFINSVAHDITVRKQAEEKLRASEVRYRLLAQNVSDVIWTLDLHQRLTYVSPSVKRLLGYTPEEAIAGGLNEALGPASIRVARAIAEEELAAERDGVVDPMRSRTMDVELRRLDGTKVWTETRASLLRDGRGRPLGFVGITRDISDRKEIEAQLRQAQKMEAIGQLAGGVAHDFRNQLTVIRGWGELLARRKLVAGVGEQYLNDVLKAVDRAASLTEQLLAFSRKQILHPEVTDLNRLVDETVRSLRQIIAENVQLRADLSDGLKSVMVDPGQFQQALINLAVNARDAMPEGGELTISTADVTLDQAFLRHNVGASMGPHIRITVRDTGVGMNEEVLKRIFEPFYTTKAPGQGTGLGLPMVYGFVRQSGGYIAVDSTPGRGTSVNIYLPRVACALEAEPAPASSAPLPAGSETILVVEDEEPIRHVMVQMLTECGYTVLAAANAREAKPLGEHYEGDIDLLLTDVIMPGVNGVKLAEQLRAARPSMKVLFVSGYADQALSEKGLDGRFAELLVKPFSSDALVRAVRRLLEQPPAPPAQDA